MGKSFSFQTKDNNHDGHGDDDDNEMIIRQPV